MPKLATVKCKQHNAKDMIGGPAGGTAVICVEMEKGEF